MLRQVSLGSIGVVIGSILSIVGVIAYANGNSTLNLIGFFYGIPVLLGGAALKSSEVKPSPFLTPTTSDVLLARNKATSTQKQVREDVTKYRYGIKAHLDEVLTKLGMSPTDEERPILVGIYEELTEIGAYSLVLRFESRLIAWEVWQEKQEKLSRFFGPNVVASVSQVEGKLVDLHLTATLAA